jgi:hypothetical protein
MNGFQLLTFKVKSGQSARSTNQVKSFMNRFGQQLVKKNSNAGKDLLETFAQGTVQEASMICISGERLPLRIHLCLHPVQL